jgi:PAS domain S-box-containing protein
MWLERLLRGPPEPARLRPSHTSRENCVDNARTSFETPDHARRTPDPAFGSASTGVDDQFRLLVDSVHDYAIFMLDTGGRIRSWNCGAERLKGYSEEEVVGEHFSVFHPSEEVAAGTPRQLLARAAADGRAETEGWRLRKDGFAFWANVVITPIHDTAGELTGFAKVTRDLTERKLAERRLAASERLLRSSLDSLDTAIAIVDENGTILTTNHAWNQLAENPAFVFVSGGEGANYLGICERTEGENGEVARQICTGLRAVLEGRNDAFALDYSCHSKGMTCWFEVKAHPFEGQQGPHIVVAHQNTTSLRLAVERQRRLVQEQASRSAAEAAQQRIADTLESITDGFFSLDRQRRFTYVNRHAEAIVGRPRGELLGRTLQEEFPDAAGSRFEAELGAVLERETPSSVEEYFAARGAWLEFRIFPSPEGASVYMRDVSDRKRAEEALRLSESRFAGIVSIAAEAIISLDQSQRITFFNEAAERMFGCSRQEVLGCSHDILVPERFRAMHRREVDRFGESAVAARPMANRGEIACSHRDGSEFLAEASISKLEVGGERVFNVVLRDISERKQIERYQQLLARSGAVLSASLDYEETVRGAAELGVQLLADYCCIDIVDETGGIQRPAVAHTDPARVEAIEALTRFPVVPALPHPLQRAIETGEPVLVPECTPEVLREWAQDDDHLRALETLAPRSMIAVPLRARDHLLGGMAFVSTGAQYSPQDVPLAAELARRVALALDNARLYENSQQAIRARDNVLRVVSHDLRNPLHTISLTTEMLLDPSLPQAPERKEKQLQIIRRSTERMTDLVEDMLDAVRIEAGALMLDPYHQSPSRLAEEAVELNRPAATARSLELETQIAAPLPPVHADRNRMLQVFSNLIGNAVKFTPEGGSITVGVAPDGGEVHFAVRDTGPGLSPEQQRHLFQPFWQARRDGRQGAGLGLSIARGIVEKHGGRIWVESEEGAGTTVYFTLPAAAERRAERSG